MPKHVGQELAALGGLDAEVAQKLDRDVAEREPADEDRRSSGSRTVPLRRSSAPPASAGRPGENRKRHSDRTSRTTTTAAR